MSTQLEFIMQLYMMNLLQQQQQQQQQLQQIQQFSQQFSQQSPKKEIIDKGITSQSESVNQNLTQVNNRQQRQQQQHQQQLKPQQQPNDQPHHQLHQHQQQKTRTLKRNNSQNTNCSSSSSCSTNSNSSPIAITNTNNNHPQHQTLQQLLLNNLSPLTPMLPTGTANANSPALSGSIPMQTPSNLILTPSTPNASVPSATLSMADYMSGSIYQNFSSQILSHTNFSNHLTAQNFLQSSTVTSTPTEKSPFNGADDSAVGEVDVPAEAEDDDDEEEEKYYDDGEGVDEGVRSKNMAVKGDADESGGVEELETDATADNCAPTTTTTDDEDDDKPLSSLYSSSGIASTSIGSTGSAETTNKLLLSSSVQALESTTDSGDSMKMPYTPVKQAADSSFSAQIPTMTYCKDASTPAITSSSTMPVDSFTSYAVDQEQNSNATTPLALVANAILTPPSSEQLGGKSFESSCQSQTATSGNSTTCMSLSSGSSIDAILQNEESLKNLKKFSSYLECENPLCRQENLREHFHCFDEPCKGKILSKKDDIIRHLKWHKKRKDSLLLGFARFSASDDCGPEYGEGCAYNWKQTHYHCIYEECPKVYVSTSDVQMHANFHRKNSEIVQEGFRRFRAHENCKIEECPFYGKKTSHYHCCREGCNHTFKNKADMEKHKSYHLKDYQLTQDGFKKILKTEVCPFDGCKFSTVCNHIHCVREGCNFILHSSTQMISHKRKHDRADGEQAYQSFKKEKNSSEEESPLPVQSSSSSSNASTPLSSLSAEHFLSRKRGRPPKKIQLPSSNDDSETIKRIKVEPNSESTLSSLPAGVYPPFLPNLTSAVNAVDPNTPNFQLTHLMALFQLQNPLFYQNLYPGLSGGGGGNMIANMTNVLNAAAAAASSVPALNPSAVFGNLAAIGAAANTAQGIKKEFNDPPQPKD